MLLLENESGSKSFLKCSRCIQLSIPWLVIGINVNWLMMNDGWLMLIIFNKGLELNHFKIVGILCVDKISLFEWKNKHVETFCVCVVSDTLSYIFDWMFFHNKDFNDLKTRLWIHSIIAHNICCSAVVVIYFVWGMGVMGLDQCLPTILSIT